MALHNKELTAACKTCGCLMRRHAGERCGGAGERGGDGSNMFCGMSMTQTPAEACAAAGAATGDAGWSDTLRAACDCRRCRTAASYLPKRHEQCQRAGGGSHILLAGFKPLLHGVFALKSLLCLDDGDGHVHEHETQDAAAQPHDVDGVGNVAAHVGPDADERLPYPRALIKPRKPRAER